AFDRCPEIPYKPRFRCSSRAITEPTHVTIRHKEARIPRVLLVPCDISRGGIIKSRIDSSSCNALELVADEVTGLTVSGAWIERDELARARKHVDRSPDDIEGVIIYEADAGGEACGS